MASVAYNEGKAARRADDPEPRNPYEPGTADYAQWVDGWCAARQLSPRGEAYIKDWVIQRHKQTRSSTA